MVTSKRVLQLALIIPAVLIVLVLFIFPIWEMIFRSFTEFRPEEEGLGVFGNYIWFFTTQVNITVLIRTFVTSAAATILTLLVAYPYAYVMTRVSVTWRSVMMGIVLLTFWTSLMVRNYAWLILFQRKGLINSILEFFGLGPLEILGTPWAVMIGMSQILLPFMLLPLYASISTIDKRLTLAAQSLGAKPAKAFWKVYFPLSMPGVLAGGVLVFVLALGFYITPAILGSPQNAMFSQLIITQIEKLLAWGRGGAMAVVLFAATVLLLLVGLLAQRMRGNQKITEKVQ